MTTVFEAAEQKLREQYPGPIPCCICGRVGEFDDMYPMLSPPPMDWFCREPHPSPCGVEAFRRYMESRAGRAYLDDYMKSVGLHYRSTEIFTAEEFKDWLRQSTRPTE